MKKPNRASFFLSKAGWLGALLLSIAAPLWAQLSGYVSDEKGEALAYASIYVEGSTKGTTTNHEGYYVLALPKGTYKIIAQYIGYRPHYATLTVGEKPIKHDVMLQPEELSLREIEVVAAAEDPAYPVIRQAIAKRTYYKNLIPEYACEVYVKGFQKVLEAPQKILGRDVGDLGGNLDSTRKGIVYLSESYADFFFKAPNTIKEVMHSSKVSGRDNGFSFNRASLMNFSPYDNTIDIGRPILSPIANTALNFYTYKLMGSTYNDQRQLIYKIQVIPKIPEEPTLAGYIYIVDELWNIQSVELMLTGKSVQQPLLDTLWWRQLYVPVAAPDKWCLFSQTIDFGAGFFGFKIKGNFSGVYTNYNLQPQFEKNFFTNEVFTVEENANKKDSAYWAATRPIPLTPEEAIDYVRKDSIQTIRESKPYQDSLDRKANRFKPINVLLGYSYRNSWQQWSIGFQPLNAIGFNAIQGFYIEPALDFEYTFDKIKRNRLRVKPTLNYGFAEQKVRTQIEATYIANRIRFTTYSVSGGTGLSQYNSRNPISPLFNSYYSYVFSKNYARFYDQTFVAAGLSTEVRNGWQLKAQARYERRQSVQNAVRKGASYNEDIFWANHIAYPQNYDPEVGKFPTYDAFVMSGSVAWTPAQPYFRYPHVKINEDSRFPTFTLSARAGLPLGKATADFVQVQAGIKKSLTQFGLWGYSAWEIEGGYFPVKNSLQNIDYQHFDGNQLLVAMSRKAQQFLCLPYYEYSNSAPYARALYEHNFEGLLFNKIPYFNRLGFQEVLSWRALYVQNKPLYQEWSVGIDNIGWGVLKLFRIDIVNRFRDRRYDGTGVVIGMKL